MAETPLWLRSTRQRSATSPELAGEAMDEAHALSELAALGQATRLAIFRELVRQEPEGVPAGALADAVGCPHNTLSTHIAISNLAGCITGRSAGFSVKTLRYLSQAASCSATHALCSGVSAVSRSPTFLDCRTPATQFHCFAEFTDAITASLTVGDEVRVPDALIQPIATRDLADEVARSAAGPPLAGIENIGGPRKISFERMARAVLARHGETKTVVVDPRAAYFGGSTIDE
jgi:hypothetical protein